MGGTWLEMPDQPLLSLFQVQLLRRKQMLQNVCAINTLWLALIYSIGICTTDQTILNTSSEANRCSSCVDQEKSLELSTGKHLSVTWAGHSKRRKCKI